MYDHVLAYSLSMKADERRLPSLDSPTYRQCSVDQESGYAFLCTESSEQHMDEMRKWRRKK